MDQNSSHRHKRTVPIRRRHGEGSSFDATSLDVEGTFIPLAAADSSWKGVDFINNKFNENDDEEEEVVISLVDLQTEEKPPLCLLFPDLESKDLERISRTTSTTQVAQLLMGKKADFSLLKPSKKLNPEQCPLPAIQENPEEHSHDDEVGT